MLIEKFYIIKNILPDSKLGCKRALHSIFFFYLHQVIRSEPNYAQVPHPVYSNKSFHSLNLFIYFGGAPRCKLTWHILTFVAHYTYVCNKFRIVTILTIMTIKKNLQFCKYIHSHECARYIASSNFVWITHNAYIFANSTSEL